MKFNFDTNTILIILNVIMFIAVWVAYKKGHSKTIKVVAELAKHAEKMTDENTSLDMILDDFISITDKLLLKKVSKSTIKEKIKELDKGK